MCGHLHAAGKRSRRLPAAIGVHQCVCVYVYACVYMCVYVYVDVYIYIHILNNDSASAYQHCSSHEKEEAQKLSMNQVDWRNGSRAHCVLQCVAGEWVSHCNSLQHAATHTLQHTATHCNTLQHTATHCNTLQHAATHCNALQHTASTSASCKRFTRYI